MDVCTLKVFEISKMALSDYKEHQEKMNNVNDFFDCVFLFLKDRKLINTKVSNEDGLNLYCYDLKKIGTDYVMILWLGVEDASGASISSLYKNSEIGSRAKKNTFGDDQIPGIPAYFYISSKLNKVVTMEFKGSSADSSLLTQYIRDFMHNFSEFADHKYDEEGKKSGGFKVKKDDEYYCYFSFDLKRFINASVEKDLVMNYKYITHINTTSQIEIKTDTHSSVLDIVPILKLFSDKRDDSVIRSSVKISSPVRFESGEEVSVYIDKIRKSYDIHKVGFAVNAPSFKTVLYLANSQAKEKIVLKDANVSVKDIPVWPYNANDIAASLSKENLIDKFITASSRKNVHPVDIDSTGASDAREVI